MYFFTSGGTYNSLAVSTLSNEIFFADLVRYDKESHGYPKETNVSRVFGRVMLMNHFKHKQDKNYYLAVTVKAKYEVQLAEPDYNRYVVENEIHFDGTFQNHFFDYPNELKSQCTHRDDITTGLTALHNTEGVRRWFRTVESDILPETHGGHKVKGFTLQKNVY